MRVELGRVVALCLAVSLPPLLSSSCATGEEDTFEPRDDDGGLDSSAGTGFGGSGAGATGGTGVGGTDPGGNGGVNPGGTGPGGVGGTDPGGTGGTDPGGTGGQLGASGANGTSGAAGVSGSGGICNPAFCPNTGSGTPCCIMGLDTCGMDNGMGCVKTD